MKSNKPTVKKAKHELPDIVRYAWDIDYATRQAQNGKIGWATVRSKAQALMAYCEGVVNGANQNIEAARARIREEEQGAADWQAERDNERAIELRNDARSDDEN